MDCHRFDADPDPDPTFHFDADPAPDPTSNYTQVGKSDFLTSVPVYFTSHQFHRCHKFQYFGQHFQIFWKKIIVIL
jgi:hypothetical protein